MHFALAFLQSSFVRGSVKYLFVGQLLLYLLYYRIGLSSAAAMTPGAVSFLDLTVYYYAATVTTLVARGVQVGLLPGTWAIQLVSNIVSVFEYLMCKPVVPCFDYLLQTLSHLSEYYTTL